MAEKQSSNKKSFKDTLNLPQTDFPIRAQAKVDDPAMLKRWEQEKLFEQSFAHNKGNRKYILLDGPPYANGHIHLGTAYNKILKDMLTKSQRMFGRHVPVTPGWDCHGLPIELKVTQEHPGLSRSALKKACRAYAQKWIDIQREEFKRLGVLMDWERPYLTMDFDYEATVLRVFGQFVDAGYIERSNKTVPWCASCQTVLAAAEIEYYERKDPSIYVLFPLEQTVVKKLFPTLKDQTVNLLIWTTTPWTLPLNRAVLLKPQAEYVVLDVDGKNVIVGKNLADKLCAMMEVEKKVVAEFVSQDLADLAPRAQHPFIEDLTVPIILDQTVMLDEGTACVHSAPGVGPTDYEVGIKNNLEIFSPISPDGNYTEGIAPKELEGMPVADGQIWVIKKLAERDKLLFKTSVRHPYPHCWRCRNSLIFRATKQWFLDLARNNLKQKVLQATEHIATIPEKSINRLRATIEGRLEWCISRQRVWGVPIPALICTQCDYTFINKKLIDQVAKHVATQGIEYWDDVDQTTLLPKGFSCPNCKSTELVKEQDILDVWFDSGVSHFAVLKENPELGFPADMYLEGKDQHRGWFQSSLLTSVALSDEPPMKTIMTHGFTVDKQGRKMSKSLGNVIVPQEMIDKLGTDGLRLWVSSIDASGDAVVSDILIRNVQEVFRKIRNTCRFLLSNLYDFNIKTDVIPLDKLSMIDQYALQELFEVNRSILQSYVDYDFTAVFHTLGDYCAVNLSSFYLDIVKDRLYVQVPDGHERRSVQTVCWYILDTLTRLMAPILSFTAEQVSDLYQKEKKQSIHLQQFAVIRSIWQLLAEEKAAVIDEFYTAEYKARVADTVIHITKSSFLAQQEGRWELLKSMRSALLKAIEEQREKGLIKHSLEARVTMYVDPKTDVAKMLEAFVKDLEQKGQSVENFFKEFLIVSQFIVVADKDDLAESGLKGLFVKIEHAQGDKCPRCWQWEVTEHEDKLCSRCQDILKKLGK